MLGRTDERVIAEIRSYDDLLHALRERAETVGAPRRELDRVGGWADGLAAKVLGLPQVKPLSRGILGPLLLVLGTKLALHEDETAAAKYTSRLDKRLHAGNDLLAIRKRRRARASAARACTNWGRRMRALQLLKQSPSQRQQIARIAATARWKRRSATAQLPRRRKRLPTTVSLARAA
jgi:hypothetical protein